MFGFIQNKTNELWNIVAPEPTEEERFLSGISAGDLTQVESYLSSGKWDVHRRNSNGNTCLHSAVYSGRRNIVDCFLELGADPMAVGQRNNTCLHYAAAGGHMDLVQLFVSLGNSPICKNDMGKTPYDLAEGFGVRQFLMPLMFSEEQRTGTAPVMAGATLDPTLQAQRLANLAPPPSGGASYQPYATSQTGYSQSPPQTATPPVHSAAPPTNFPGIPHHPPQSYSAPPAMIQAQQNRPYTPPPASSTPPMSSKVYRHSQSDAAPRRTIKPDGFITTVGNPELASQYGNNIAYRPIDSRGSTPPTQAPPVYSKPAASPFAKAGGRYVGYNAATNSSVPQQSQNRAPVYAPPSQFSKVQVFNPASQPASNSGPGNNHMSNVQGSYGDQEVLGQQSNLHHAPRNDSSIPQQNTNPIVDRAVSHGSSPGRSEVTRIQNYDGETSSQFGEQTCSQAGYQSEGMNGDFLSQPSGVSDQQHVSVAQRISHHIDESNRPGSPAVFNPQPVERCSQQDGVFNQDGGLFDQRSIDDQQEHTDAINHGVFDQQLPPSESFEKHDSSEGVFGQQHDASEGAFDQQHYSSEGVFDQQHDSSEGIFDQPTQMHHSDLNQPPTEGFNQPPTDAINHGVFDQQPPPSESFEKHDSSEGAFDQQYYSSEGIFDQSTQMCHSNLDQPPTEGFIQLSTDTINQGVFDQQPPPSESFEKHDSSEGAFDQQYYPSEGIFDQSTQMYHSNLDQPPTEGFIQLSTDTINQGVFDEQPPLSESFEKHDSSEVVFDQQHYSSEGIFDQSTQMYHSNLDQPPTEGFIPPPTDTINHGVLDQQPPPSESFEKHDSSEGVFDQQHYSSVGVFDQPTQMHHSDLNQPPTEGFNQPPTDTINHGVFDQQPPPSESFEKHDSSEGVFDQQHYSSEGIFDQSTPMYHSNLDQPPTEDQTAASIEFPQNFSASSISTMGHSELSQANESRVQDSGVKYETIHGSIDHNSRSPSSHSVTDVFDSMSNDFGTSVEAAPAFQIYEPLLQVPVLNRVLTPPPVIPCSPELLERPPPLSLDDSEEEFI